MVGGCPRTSTTTVPVTQTAKSCCPCYVEAEESDGREFRNFDEVEMGLSCISKRAKWVFAPVVGLQ
jgi:hypothetical protein